MTDKVVELNSLIGGDSEAEWVSSLWTRFNNQKQEIKATWLELRNYVFATDTSTTSNKSLPWKNSTTLPKLCQIRDNLHSNYLSAIMPNDKWLSWQGATRDDATKKKKHAIQSYMDNKIRLGRTRTEFSRLLYDYIDTGNAFTTVSFESRYVQSGGETRRGFVGPKLHRISPSDIVFNPLATTFEDSFKIVRSLKTLGELKKAATTHPEMQFWNEVIERRQDLTKTISTMSEEDWDKMEAFQVDGFGSYQEYLMTDNVEILEFYGDYYNAETGELQTNRMITVADRAFVARNVDIPTYNSVAPIRHVAWRRRPDNLWGMGPLENLIGLQYRIDHLENAKADAHDMALHAPLKIIGEVESFNWGPGEQIHIDENGDVQELGMNLNAIITGSNDIQLLEDKMELYAGAPREAAGVRSPGEKTAFEVQSLENAAGRIFQEKAINFEVELLEPALNDMLEISVRNFDASDIISAIDNDIGVQHFMELTKEDITANGVLRPVGARHFAQRAQELQNIIGVLSSPVLPSIAPHFSAIAFTDYLNDSLDIRQYKIFRANVGVMEQQETQRMINQATEDLDMESQGVTEEEVGLA